MTEQTSYTFEDCIKKCESIIDGIYQDGCQSIHLYSLKTFIYGMVDIHNKTTIELQDEVNQFRAIGTVEEFKDLKEKSVAKKPIEKVLPYSEEFGFNSEWKCPTCGAYVGYFSEGMSEPEQMEYCNECGQHIAKDWTET